MGARAIPQLVTQLLHDGVALARAEVQLAKSRVSVRLAAAKSGIIYLAAAALVAVLALIGLVVGIVLALTPLVGGLLAGLIVLAVGGALAGVLGWLGIRRLTAKPDAVAVAIHEAPSTPLLEKMP